MLTVTGSSRNSHHIGCYFVIARVDAQRYFDRSPLIKDLFKVSRFEIIKSHYQIFFSIRYPNEFLIGFFPFF